MSPSQNDQLAASVAAVDLNDQNTAETQSPRASPADADTMLAAKEAPAVVADDADDADEAEFGEPVELPPLEPKTKKKNKKKKRPASKRGLGKPTGFEDFFADAPMTPDQHAQNQELYNPSIPFVDRIITAVGRFERTRKLTPERRDIFFKWLVYGGVNIGPRAHQGAPDTEDLDNAQIAAVLSQASASKDKYDLSSSTRLYDVDFHGVMRSFLSRRSRTIYGCETPDEVSTVTTTLERFLDYLLQHDVCPEYQTDVLTTRDFCRSATSELWHITEAIRRLPGDFNIACSTLSGGYYAENYDALTDWETEPDTHNEAVFVGMKREEAEQVMSFGVAGAADESVYQAYLDAVRSGTPVAVTEIEEMAGFEITRIDPPTPDCKAIYTSTTSNFRPVGRVYAKSWTNPDSQPEDLTDEEQKQRALLSSPKPTKEYVFLVEELLQTYLRVGTKIEATIYTLSCGIMFFDNVVNVFPSFDEVVVNELMQNWTTPRPKKGAFDYVEGEDGDDKDDDDGDNDGADGNGDGKPDHNDTQQGDDDDTKNA
ncbi:hypothetical protein PV08_01840 [Exophiala spinifera]|uniref:Argonaute siRNA chaperone complex subunit Arb1 n=1 Tax=Exophiala spinifera TaxID=91928 RepID=A0A0D2BS48_9EURO|nr:uncharacterized protein PV08_01840 [Exophiala spinifera]KIW21260.1 hypothetical protein PV08_01840 [Exophiala spinifera]